MLFSTVATVAALSLVDVVVSQAVHGESAQGSSMGPAAFMFPPDRPWSADHDNIAPCGSASGPVNRTEFPLGSSGSVSFSIADDSYKVALRIAYGNNPTSQQDFVPFQGNISQFEPGHQCYSVPAPPSTITPGSNATFQLEYWANDSGSPESFYACADITYVEAQFFTTQIPCFNVTADEFTPAGASPTSAAPKSEETGKGVEPSVQSGSSGLSAGAKGGIAVGAIVGFALIAGAIFFFVRRNRSVSKDAEAAPHMTKVASFTSAETGNRN